MILISVNSSGGNFLMKRSGGMRRIMNFIRMLFALVLLLVPTLVFAETVQLPRTGQTTCYNMVAR